MKLRELLLYLLLLWPLAGYAACDKPNIEARDAEALYEGDWAILHLTWIPG